MKTFDCEQYSAEWWAVRRGVPTCSMFSSIITPTGKPSAQAHNYICQLIGDRLRDDYGTQDEYVSAAMKNGALLEPEARRFYEFERGVTVKQIGFILDDTGRFGYSPDGVPLEIKSPQAKTHVAYLLDGGLPPEHRPQVHGGLVVTGWDYIDFMSYCPGLPPLLVRVEPDEYTDLLRAAMESFWLAYQAAWDRVQAMLPEPVAVAANEADELPPMF